MLAVESNLPGRPTQRIPGSVDPIASLSGWQLFYKYRPSGPNDAAGLTLEYFEEIVLQRLECLSKLYNLQQQGKPSDELKRAYNMMGKLCTVAKIDPVDQEITDEAKRQKFYQDQAAKFPNIFNNDSDDQVSHYALRLALSGNQRWATWLVQAETLYFRQRLADIGDPTPICRAHKLDISPFTPTVALPRHMAVVGPLAEGSRLFTVPFHHVPSLVSRRAVVVNAGRAIVKNDQIVELLVNRFRDAIESSLVAASRARAALVPVEGDRVLASLEHMVTNYGYIDTADAAAAVDIEAAGAEISAAAVDSLAGFHWPPCMRHMHAVLRKDKHLKHFARVYYTLFLKSMRMPVEENLTFWRESLASGGNSATGAGFDKGRYAYNVRHLYGLEGQRKAMSAYSCAKIIDGAAPGPQLGQAHGCPFRHWAESDLRGMLQAPVPIPPAIAAMASDAAGDKTDAETLSVPAPSAAGATSGSAAGAGGGDTKPASGAASAAAAAVADEAEAAPAAASTGDDAAPTAPDSAARTPSAVAATDDGAGGGPEEDEDDAMGVAANHPDASEGIPSDLDEPAPKDGAGAATGADDIATDGIGVVHDATAAAAAAAAAAVRARAARNAVLQEALARRDEKGRLKLTDQQVRGILDHTRGGAYVHACNLYFDATHPAGGDHASMAHPSGWAKQSLRYVEALLTPPPEPIDPAAAAAAAARAKAEEDAFGFGDIDFSAAPSAPRRKRVCVVVGGKKEETDADVGGGAAAGSPSGGDDGAGSAAGENAPQGRDGEEGDAVISDAVAKPEQNEAEGG